LTLPRFADIPKALLTHAQAQGVQQLLFNCEYGLDEQGRDTTVAKLAAMAGLTIKTFHGSVVVPPGAVLTKSNQPFKVFSPFKRRWLQVAHTLLQPVPTPQPMRSSSVLKNTPVAAFINADKSGPLPEASEKSAHHLLSQFIERQLFAYDQQRDFPALPGTSGLSPYLSMGLISPRICVHSARIHNQGELHGGQAGCDSWINELIWRDFYLHIVQANPAVSRRCALKPETDRLVWRQDKKQFAAWCEGRTGFPLVDAAMRQLNQTGWMHNRLRMVVATFLVKYLLIDWRWGEDYFMQQLMDAHFAANNGGWQWCASTGTDAAPYFRILSPVRQAQRFDPEAKFIKQFVSELQNVSARAIHQPGCSTLLATGYPAPMVDLASAKNRCIKAFKAL
ncbi:MAG: FAD-binding domain-containing protein, partial [Gammaproteobacteria bacterium]